MKKKLRHANSRYEAGSHGPQPTGIHRERMGGGLPLNTVYVRLIGQMVLIVEP